jgi:hypothetical protein
MRKYMVQTRWFFAWQTDRECAWLGQMTREGWQLVCWRPMATYIFMRQDPARELEYRIERKGMILSPSAHAMETYLEERAQEGWQLLQHTWSWAFFSRPV